MDEKGKPAGTSAQDGAQKKLSVEPYKGVRDFYPEAEAIQKYLFGTMRQVAERYGYVEYDASILEPAQLYRGKQAENEEIVNEQTYTFADRGGREVTLRPEMTPTVARMVAARRRELAFPLRWFSLPNVFRYERPQRGRLREHWQLNVDIFGAEEHAADAEVITVAHRIMLAFGAQEDDFTIRIGSRAHLNQLCVKLGLDEVRSKAFFNLLDRKRKMPAGRFAEELAALGVDERKLTDGAPADVTDVLDSLEKAGVRNAVFDPSIVRGFAYYTGIVFEVFDTNPENSRSLFGGGRYDNLLSLFGGEVLPGFGFGMGDVTMRDFLEVRKLLPPYIPSTKLYLALPSPALYAKAFELAESLRASGISVAVDFGDRKHGDQIKTAHKQRVPYLVVVGEDEIASETYRVRDMQTGAERPVSRGDLAACFLNPES